MADAIETASGTPADDRPEAVFIVGVSRSGTTLLRRILERSSEVAICAENHFLGHLIGSQGVRHRLRRFGDLRSDDAVTRLVDFIYSGGLERSSRLRTVSRQWRWTIRHVPREEFRERMLASDRSERALFTALLRSYADNRGKPVMGEKTPAHVRYVDTILAWYPNARVVHMMRDPRAVYVSELRRRREAPESAVYRMLARVPPLFAPAVLLQVTAAWLESVWRLERHRRRYPNRYYLLRFEDLVRDPAREVPALCAFLGIGFEPEMLEQVVVSQGHNLGQTGFDTAAASRWRLQIGRSARAWLAVWCGRRLRKLGYEP